MTLLWNPLTPKDAPYGSEEKNIAFMIGHCGLFMFNFLNVSYILLFEGFAFGRLGQNSLLKIALCGCSFQMCSCVTSIIRYNINDEYGFYATLGTIFGLIAFSFGNSAYLSLIFPEDHRSKAFRIGTLVWVLISVGCFVITQKNWEEDNFESFRVYVAASTVYQTVALIIGHRALTTTAAYQQGNDTAITLTNVFKVLIVLDAGGLVFTGLAGLPIVTYPATGLTFTVTVIAMSFVGRSDLMRSMNAASGTEKESLVGRTGGLNDKYESTGV